MKLASSMRASLAVALGLVVAPTPRSWAIAPEKTPARLSLEAFQVKDGLPGDSVQAIAQASDGRLWVATLGGVVRYDGTRFSPVPVPELLGRATSAVDELIAARDGSVWLGSRHHGPMRFVGGAVRGFGRADGLPDDIVARAYAEDDGGHLWLASSRGLYKHADDRFIPHPVRGFEGLHATALALDASRTPWLGTRTGLYAVVGDRLVRADAVTGAITALHVVERRLWAAGGGVLVAFEAGNEDGKPVLTVGKAEGLPAAAITAIAHDDDGNLWLATGAGLVRVRQGKAELYTGADAVPGGEVTSVLIDRERGLWVGTRLGGLVHLTDRTLDTHVGPPGLVGTETLAVAEDADGAMWFGTRGQGAVRWQDGVATWVGEAQGLPSAHVTAILPDGPGAVWLGTHAGLVRWQVGRARVEDRGLFPRRVRTLYRAKNGTLWVGGDGVLAELADGRVTLYDRKDGLIGGNVRVIAEDGAGVLWVSGVGGVVHRRGAGFVKAIALQSKPAGQVRAMLLDSAGAFWLTTGRGGLVRLRPGSPEVAFDASVGLEPDMLYGLIEDDSGDLWIGTNRSILRLARSSLEAVAERRHTALQVASFETTDRRTGVTATQLHQPSVWKARGG